MSEQDYDLTPMFEPASIAIVGASSNPASPGSRPLRLFDKLGAPAVAYAVNPGQSTIGDRVSYARIQDIGEPVDLAVVQVPREHALAAIDDCIEAGARSILLLTAGFREFDEEGARLEEEVKERVRSAGIPMLGPNSLGWCDFAARTVVSQTEMFELLDHVPGRVSIVTQSGAFGGAIWVLGMERGIGFGKFVSTGNETDIDAAGVLSYLAQDAATDVIAVYLEAVRNGPRFRRALEECAAAGKPVVLLKVGSSDVGARAAASHTGAAAGSDVVFDAAIEGLPVFRAGGPEEMLDALYALQQTRTRTPSQAAVVVTNSGGYGVLISDLASATGLPMPPLRPAIADRVHEIQPNATTTNPIDITGIPPRNRKPPYNMFAEIVEVLVEEDQYDTLLLNTYVTPQIPRWQEVQETVIRLAPTTDKRLVVIGLTEPDFRRRLTAAGALVFEQPRQALEALAAANGIHAALATFRPRAAAGPATAADTEALAALAAARAEGRRMLDEVESKRVLAAIGVSVAREAVVASADEAVAAAGELGYPVVVKGLAPHLTHKSDHGLVAVGIRDDAALRDTFARIAGTLAELGDGGTGQAGRIVVQEMVTDGVECIVGIESDPTFGPVVMVGAGGVLTELVEDHALALCPVTREEAERLIARTRVGKLLTGYRSSTPRDVDALADAIVAVSGFAARHPDAVASIDVNPLLVREQGRGAVAVDGLVLVPEGGA